MGKPKNPFHLLLKGPVQVTDRLSRCIPRLVDFHRGLGGGQGLKTVFSLISTSMARVAFSIF